MFLNMVKYDIIILIKYLKKWKVHDYSLISLLFVGIVLLLLSFTWLVPGLGVGYGTQALLNKFQKPYSFSASVYVNTIGLVITQIVLFSTILHPEKSF